MSIRAYIHSGATATSGFSLSEVEVRLFSDAAENKVWWDRVMGVEHYPWFWGVCYRAAG